MDLSHYRNLDNVRMARVEPGTIRVPLWALALGLALWELLAWI